MGKRSKGKAIKQKKVEINKRKEKLKHIGAVLLIFIVSFAIYANTLKNEFVLDDKKIIVENMLIKNTKNISCIFTESYWTTPFHTPFFGKMMGLYRPFTIFTYALNYKVNKLEPLGYHLVNIMLHTLNCVVLYFFCLKILKNNILSLATTLIFATHPIHTEPVANVVGRAELLAFFFFFSSLLLYINNGKFGRFKIIAYILSFIAFFLALLSKEHSITLIGVLFIYDLIFIHHGNLKEYLKLIKSKYAKIYCGYFITIMIYLSIRYAVLGNLFIPTLSIYFTDNFLINAPLYPKILTGMKILKEYIWLLFYPANLTIDYSPSRISISYSILEFDSFISLFLLLGIILIIIISYKNSPKICFSVLYFLITYSIISNIIIMIGTVMNERLIYLPSVGFSLFIVLILKELFDKISSIKNFSFGIILVIVPLTIWYSIKTVERNKDWQNEITLLKSTLKVSKDSFFSYRQLAGLYESLQEHDKAMQYYDKALRCSYKLIKLDPNNPNYYNSIGRILEIKKMYNKAIYYYEKAVKIDPNFGYAYYNLGSLYFKKGDYQRAIIYFKKTIKIFPHFPEAYNNLGMIYWQIGELDKAIHFLRKAIKLNPYYQVGHFNLGKLYVNLKHYENATFHFKRAIELNPNDSDVHANIGAIYYYVYKDYNKSFYHLNKAIKLNPNREDVDLIKGIITHIKRIKKDKY